LHGRFSLGSLVGTLTVLLYSGVSCDDLVHYWCQLLLFWALHILGCLIFIFLFLISFCTIIFMLFFFKVITWALFLMMLLCDDLVQHWCKLLLLALHILGCLAFIFLFLISFCTIIYMFFFLKRHHLSFLLDDAMVWWFGQALASVVAVGLAHFRMLDPHPPVLDLLQHKHLYVLFPKRHHLRFVPYDVVVWWFSPVLLCVGADGLAHLRLLDSFSSSCCWPHSVDLFMF
jgi:hypothetical protein